METKKGNFKAFNQDYKGFIVIETAEELEQYIKEVLSKDFRSNLHGYRNNLRNSIKEGYQLAFNPYNYISYFTIPKGTEITFI